MNLFYCGTFYSVQFTTQYRNIIVNRSSLHRKTVKYQNFISKFVVVVIFIPG